MRCASCGGDMEFKVDQCGFLCPYCGAYEKVDQEGLNEEDIQKLINDSISKHEQDDHVEKNEESRASGLFASFWGIIAYILLSTWAVIALILTLFGFTSETKNIPLGIVALIQMCLLIAVMILRGAYRTRKNKMRDVIANLLPVLAALTVIVFLVLIVTI